MAFVTIASTSDLPPGERIIVEVDDIWVAVFNVAGNLYAIEDQCTHDGESLAESGELRNEDSDSPSVECDRHGATFELKTGKPTFPASVPVHRYPVRVEGDDVQIDVAEPMQLQ